MQSYASYESACSPLKYFPSIKILSEISHAGDVCPHINQLRHERLSAGMGMGGEHGGRERDISLFNFPGSFFLPGHPVFSELRSVCPELLIL